MGFIRDEDAADGFFYKFVYYLMPHHYGISNSLLYFGFFSGFNSLSWSSGKVLSNLQTGVEREACGLSDFEKGADGFNNLKAP